MPEKRGAQGPARPSTYTHTRSVQRRCDRMRHQKILYTRPSANQGGQITTSQDERRQQQQQQQHHSCCCQLCKARLKRQPAWPRCCCYTQHVEGGLWIFASSAVRGGYCALCKQWRIGGGRRSEFLSLFLVGLAVQINMYF